VDAGMVVVVLVVDVFKGTKTVIVLAASLVVGNIKKVDNGRTRIKKRIRSHEIHPKAGEDHVKKIKGKEKTWCG
jgi:hypothetical protein